MKQLIILTAMVALAVPAMADTFGTGDNQFTIDFVTISGSTNPTSGIPAGDGFTFTGVNHNYRMGTYEITNDQWNKFKAAYGAVAGSQRGYSYDSNFNGLSVPTNEVSWYEAAQFVNWLNTCKGYQAAYKFIGTQGTSDYTLDVWSASDTGYNAVNPYRNTNAFYFLPTENEWVKAAYWNGSVLQDYATKAGESLYLGNGLNGGWNYFYYYDVHANNPVGLWNVGSGSQELNGTYDMMGNAWEWTESPYITGQYLYGSARVLRGGSYDNADNALASSYYDYTTMSSEDHSLGFRVASIPEPCTLLLLGIGSFILRRKK